MMIESIVEKFAPLTSSLFRDRTRVYLSSIPRSAETLSVCSLSKQLGKTVVWIADSRHSLEILHRNLLSLTRETDCPILYYPPWDTFPSAALGKDHRKKSKGVDVDNEITGHRLRVLNKLATARPSVTPPKSHAGMIVATCVHALMEKTCSPEFLNSNTVSLSIGHEADVAELAAALVKCGYESKNEVVAKGQFSIRGGIFDVWPVTELWPLRIEFLGAAIESIRSFDPGDQKSKEKLSAVVLPPARELSGGTSGAAPFHNYLPDDAIFVWSQMDDIEEHASLYEEAIIESGAETVTLHLAEIRNHVESCKKTNQMFIGQSTAPASETVEMDAQPLEGVVTIPREVLQPDLVEQTRKRLITSLQAKASEGHTVVVFEETEASVDHFKTQFPQATEAGIKTAVGYISEGFSSNALKLAIVSESDLYGRRNRISQRYDPEPQHRRPEPDLGTRVSDLTDIEPGDLVVHVEHGIGKYRGLSEITSGGQRQEVLTIEYAEGAKLHVPVSHAHLLTRYVGASRHRPDLHHLGGKRWLTEKTAAESALRDLASSLLEIQAQRSHLPGHAFPSDVPWQHEFEASFPYWETPDQHTAIVAVRSDMESARPMDRLVCGDAGYGKTEVAMRAAFKAVMGTKQVAVLVPTTVLAQQHFETFSERMSSYPVRIEMLSRFRSRSQQIETLKGLAKGTVDIVIGTHALLQPDVQFKDLGLVIIDEEQRFGVTHKEHLKHIRRLTDVLTMTATPIPRTLYMSLTGARDISIIQTPPNERMAIETIVTTNTDKTVRDAIMRELSREGQVFYLHNRVMTIEHVMKRLTQLLPEARIAVAHGQMPTSELAAVVQKFAGGEFDVLLCTTIMESGVDIPRANTILIDRADRFGIADLYQLRGRVGRSNRKAYAYLLLPAHGDIDTDARKRIAAIKQHSSLGAGFRLALRDLEIRGAGNLLGAEQSGHISAIGFGLYCQLLKRTVAQQKGEPMPPVIDVDMSLDFIELAGAAAPDNSAIIPYGYIEDERQRVGTYRRMAEAASLSEIVSLKDELKDRFGPVPPQLGRLLKIAELRIVAAQHGIRKVETREGKVMFTRGDDYVKSGPLFPRLTARIPDTMLNELARLLRASH